MVASGSFTIKAVDPRICINENGTNVCDLGHKLKFPGTCVTQSIGTFNSTDGTFQPTFPVCVSDFKSGAGCSYGIYGLVFSAEGSQKIVSFGGISGIFKEYHKSIFSAGGINLQIKTLASPFDTIVRVWSNSISDEVPEMLRSSGITGTQKLIQHDSGVIVRKKNATSQFFQLDIFSFYNLQHPFYFVPKISDTIKIAKDAVVGGSYSEVVDSFKSGVSNPSLDGAGAPFDNPVEICVGDQIAPFLENITPSSGVVLRPFTESISFNIRDSIGGVEKSSVDINISGSLTNQTGGSTIVLAGVEQVPYASLVGTDSDYLFTYTPPDLWASNETVFVTASGTDKLPLVGGSPFSCVGGDPNVFAFNWSFQVRNDGDFSASITAIADDSAPYVDGEVPAPYSSSNYSFNDIIFHVKDDLSGVDLSSLFVYINGIAIISAGVAAAGTFISGDKNDYTVTYSNSLGFSFGSRVFVRVVAEDLYAIAPNLLDITYYYDVIFDSSLVIDNFIPPVGITYNPESVNIEVDITDSIYDVSDSNLYLSINGSTVSSSFTTLYGNRELTTTISGLTAISGTTLAGAQIFNATVTGTNLVGNDFTAGGITVGSGVAGLITNFSPPFDLTVSGELIAASIFEGNITSGTVVDALVSGTNWDGLLTNATISGVELVSFFSYETVSSGTVISGSIGETLQHHPTNDFDYGAPINVLVHGENLSSLAPVIKEQAYQLLYGYNVKVFNRNFIPRQSVNVFGSVLNLEDFSNELNFGYSFDVIDQQISDCGASITGIAPFFDLGATIIPQAPVHRYGEEVTVILYVEDVEGNALGPYTFTYTIEDEPI